MKPTLALSLARSLALSSAVALVAGAVGAAELPSRQTQPTPPAKKCRINGQEGFVLPGSDTCMRVSGFVSGQAAVGNVPSPSRSPDPR